MLAYNKAAPKVYHGEPAVGGLLTRSTGVQSPVEYRVSYINNLPTPINVGWRSGLSFTIPASNERFGDTLIIRIDISVAQTVRVDLEQLLSDINETANKELRAMRRAIELQSSPNQYGGTRISLEYPITLEELKNYGGAVYYSEIDQVFSILPGGELPHHPYGEHGRAVYAASRREVSPGIRYDITFVDNTGRLAARFLNFGGEVLKVIPIKEYGRRDGVYVHVLDDHGLDKTRRFSIETAGADLGMYLTHEEALALGNPDSIRKRQELLLEQELIKLKHAVVETKHLADLEKMERERETKNFEEKRTRQLVKVEEEREQQSYDLEVKRIEVKDHFESRSYVRKDSSEAAKFLPQAVMGIGALFMAVKAFF